MSSKGNPQKKTPEATVLDWLLPGKHGLIVYTIVLAGILLLVWFFRGSVAATRDVHFPTESIPAVRVAEEIDVHVTRGLTKETYRYVLKPGEYRPVLTGEAGVFYLSPSLGLYSQQSTRNRGYAVGGIFLPADTQAPAFVWSYPLKNRNRSFNSPTTHRPLSQSEDQPEWRALQEPGWFEAHSDRGLRRLLIDPDFSFDRGKVLDSQK